MDKEADFCTLVYLSVHFYQFAGKNIYLDCNFPFVEWEKIHFLLPI